MNQKQTRSRLHDLQSVRDQERRRIAREVHDELGQAMTALKIDLSLLNERLLNYGDGIPAKVVYKEITSMLKLVDAAIKATHRIVAEMRPELLDQMGFQNALLWQAQEFKSHTGIDCDITSGSLGILIPDSECATALFRIVQEALSNAARHSCATRVTVTLEENSKYLRLIIQDNGEGIQDADLIRPGSFGLLGMNERVTLLGGNMTIHGEPKKGTTITIQIPLSATGVAKL